MWAAKEKAGFTRVCGDLCFVYATARKPASSGDFVRLRPRKARRIKARIIGGRRK
jgi:hypothetical protein